jgi:hypothetical protein
MSWGSSYSGYQLFATQVRRWGRWNPRQHTFDGQKGLPTQYVDLVVATLDASVHGIALSIAIRPGQVYRLEGMRFDGVSTIVTFEDTRRRKCTGRRLEPQWHCGSCGACLTFETELFCSVMTACQSFFVIRKGSPSQVLQRAAEDVCKEALEAGCRVLALHVPGVQLIDERTVGGS